MTLDDLEGSQKRTMEWNVSSYKWPYLGNGERYRPRLLLITNRKWHTFCQIKWNYWLWM